jgi:hypothetical protein
MAQQLGSLPGLKCHFRCSQCLHATTEEQCASDSCAYTGEVQLQHVQSAAKLELKPLLICMLFLSRTCARKYLHAGPVTNANGMIHTK